MLVQRAMTHKRENISGGGTECGRILSVLLECKDVVVGGKKIEADLGMLEKEYAREEKAVVVDGGSRPNGHSAANGNSATNGAGKTSATGFEEVMSRTHKTPSCFTLTSTPIRRHHEQSTAVLRMNTQLPTSPIASQPKRHHFGS